MADNKTKALSFLIRGYVGSWPSRVLVVGCGSGIEASILAQSFGADVTGIDIVDQFDIAASRNVRLMVADATAMPFESNTFDFVFSYHALEHIPEYRRALHEMNRVLKSEGHWCIGTPNRSRIVGYLGSKTATLKEKLVWNLVDWRRRFKGEFRNEFGAHAGFTADELSHELNQAFGTAVDITFEYYMNVYPKYRGVLKIMHVSGFARFLFPAVYFIGAVKQKT